LIILSTFISYAAAATSPSSTPHITKMAFNDTAALLAIDVLKITKGIEANYIPLEQLEIILATDYMVDAVRHWTSDDCLLDEKLQDTLGQVADEEDGRFFITCVQKHLRVLFIPRLIIEECFD
jgi:hypothetical protein